MVLDFYNLREQPFGATPDTRYLFASETHREALASLLYGVRAGRGFIALIASPGMGKTTLLFRSLNTLKDTAKTVFLFQTISTPLDFLRTLLKDLGVDEVSGGLAELQVKLTQILAEHSRRGQQLIVVIDEAQNLDDSVLELVRMLSNFETSREKLMQIILSGQPQLARKLASPGLLQLRQRISIIAQLKPFSAEETALYIDHRLRIAGCQESKSLFTSSALRLIAEYSHGIPRNINTLCFNSLSIGAALKKREIDQRVIREVIADLDLDPLTDAVSAPMPHFKSTLEGQTRSTFRLWAAGMLIVVFAMLAFTAMTRFRRGGGPVMHQILQQQAPKQNLPIPDTSLEVRPEILPFEDVALTADAVPDDGIPIPSRAILPRERAQEGSHARRLAKYIRGSSVFTNEVLVRPGMTFYSICGDVFGTCNFRKAQELRRLNPWLRDSTRVNVGDVLVIPPRTDISEASRPPVTNP